MGNEENKKNRIMLCKQKLGQFLDLSGNEEVLFFNLVYDI